MNTEKRQAGDRRRFNVHDLYPADYSFDWEAFEADPEHYVFTKEDIAYHNAVELENYEETVPMTAYEKRALRRWVASGHSVSETPPSKYPCACCRNPPLSFLEVYRMEKELDAALKGLTGEEQLAYLKEYAGGECETREERKKRLENEELHRQTPEAVRKAIASLRRRLFYTEIYLAQEGLYEEAREFVEGHMDTPVPFEDEW